MAQRRLQAGRPGHLVRRAGRRRTGSAPRGVRARRRRRGATRRRPPPAHRRPRPRAAAAQTSGQSADGRAVAGQPGVDLEVDPGPPLGRGRRGDQPGDLVDRLGGDVDVGGDQRASGPPRARTARPAAARRRRPRAAPAPRPGWPPRARRRPAARASRAHGEHAVAVAVGLDHHHHARPSPTCAWRAATLARKAARSISAPRGRRVDDRASPCRTARSRRSPLGRVAAAAGPARPRPARPAAAAGSVPGAGSRRTACSEAPEQPRPRGPLAGGQQGGTDARRARHRTRPGRSRPGPGSGDLDPRRRSGSATSWRGALEQHGRPGLGRPRRGPRGPGPR